METDILKVLNYQISLPTIFKFFVRYLNAGHATRKLVYFCSYLLEESLLSYNMVKYMPSQHAAAAILIGRLVIGRNGWSPTLVKYTGYREDDVIPIAREMLQAKRLLSPELDSMKKKYSRRSKMMASAIPLPSSIWSL